MLWFDILLILVLILLNGVFSMAEMAMVSVRRARLQSQAENGSSGAKTALDLLSDSNTFLSTVQIGITLIGTLAGAFSGSALSHHLEPHLAALPIVGDYAETASFIIVVLSITYVSLVIGELLPKQLALAYGEQIAINTAKPMQWLTRLMKPVVFLLSASTNFMVRLLRLEPPDEPPISEEEIKILMEAGAQAGVFEDVEHDIVKNVFQMTDLRVNDLMTPRPEMIWLDIDAPVDENMRLMLEHQHTLYPLYQGELKQIVGVVAVKDLWSQVCALAKPDLRLAMQPALFVPENLSAFDAVERMSEKNTWMALVMDEYGSVQGLVTLADILTVIMGDLAPESATEDAPQFVQRADGSWLVDGILSVDDFKEHFKVDLLDSEAHEKINYQTLGGFIMTRLERIPQPADKFEWQGIRFEVLDMDGHRVDKVLVSPSVTAPEQP